MGVPRITSFLAMGLETGSKFVGVMHLIVSTCLMIYCAFFAEHTRANIGTIEDADFLYSKWYKVAVVMAVVSAIHVLLAATLLYAIYNESIVCLRIWLWAMYGLNLTAVTYILISTMVHGFSNSDIFLSFIEGLIFFSVVAYCILCVYNYYLMLKSSQDMEGPHKNNY